MISTPDRQTAIKLIKEAVASGAHKTQACQALEITIRTFQRWTQAAESQGDRRTTAARPEPANKLSAAEREMLVELCNRQEYANLPPGQIVPRLADQGIYLACEATFYRVLKEYGQLHHRGRARAPRKVTKPTTYAAAGPNQVWSWDITYCPSRTRGMFYYLYLIEDIYSRKIVGWEIHECESGAYAAELMQRTVMTEQCFRQPLVLHSDNGAPMKSVTLLAKLDELGVTPSRSRPRVSNDNPYSESLFRTLKYRPSWPSEGFTDLAETRAWVKKFTDWYNGEHRHSRIKYVTPEQRHRGEDIDILAQRRDLYEQAKAQRPERWSRNARDWQPVGEVMLNPDREEKALDQAA
jgi:putative transposase